MAYNSANSVNVKLGTCSVAFGGFDLGLTKGGVSVSIKTDTHPVNVDQFGQTYINEYIMGRTCTVTVPMAETDLNKLTKAIPGSSIVTNATTLKSKLVVSSDTGLSLRDYCADLLCHPINETNNESDFTLISACPKGEFDFSYKLDEERIYSIVFSAYVELNTGNLFVIGDNTTTNATEAVFTSPRTSGLVSVLF